ncbi:MAG: thiosulfate oxidation carrier protein SoxY [Rubrivivax sp.]
MNTLLPRRQLLALSLLPLAPARATPEALAAAIRAHTGGAPLASGRVEIEIAELVENGNTVPVTLRVGGEGAVRSLALFTERNPQPEVAVFHFSARTPRLEVHTRIRLATSQALVAVATGADGRCWQRRVEVLVTLAACIE